MYSRHKRSITSYYPEEKNKNLNTAVYIRKEREENEQEINHSDEEDGTRERDIVPMDKHERRRIHKPDDAERNGKKIDIIKNARFTNEHSGGSKDQTNRSKHSLSHWGEDTKENRKGYKRTREYGKHDRKETGRK